MIDIPGKRANRKLMRQRASGVLDEARSGRTVLVSTVPSFQMDEGVRADAEVLQGGSHGLTLLAYVSGLSASLPVDLNFVNHELQGRQLGYGRGGRQKRHLDVESDFRPAKKAHPAFLVSELDKLRESLLAHAVRVADDDSIPGTRRFYGEDPWGNRLEFIEAESTQWSVDAHRISEARALGKLFDGDRVRECENRIDCPLRVDIPSEQP